MNTKYNIHVYLRTYWQDWNEWHFNFELIKIWKARKLISGENQQRRQNLFSCDLAMVSWCYPCVPCCAKHQDAQVIKMWSLASGNLQSWKGKAAIQKRCDQRTVDAAHTQGAQGVFTVCSGQKEQRTRGSRCVGRRSLLWETQRMQKGQAAGCAGGEGQGQILTMRGRQDQKGEGDTHTFSQAFWKDF